jgi:hypothetical protein
MRQFATVSISPWRLETPYNGAVNTAQNNYYTAASSPSAANTAQNNYYTAASSPSAANTAQNYYTAVSSPKQSLYRRIVAPPAPQFSHPGVQQVADGSGDESSRCHASLLTVIRC